MTHALPPESAPAAALRRSSRLFLKARDAFYEKRFTECIERCQECLLALLPERDGVQPTPEQQADRFLAAWSACLPVMEAERIAGVFTWFVRRKAQFAYERGRPLPRREWWSLLTVTREEAGAVLGATRTALEAVRHGAART